MEQEAGLGHELLRNAISVWTPASEPVQKSITSRHRGGDTSLALRLTHRFAPCFRIIREEGKYKRLRNADKFQARVSKIRKALTETSTRPVAFHEQVCLGEDDVSRED